MRQELVSVTDRIHGLLAQIERGDYPEQASLDNTLTDGYAWALTLDGECDRLERRISEHAARLGANSSAEEARELSGLARLLARRRRELEELRDLLAAMRAGVQEARVA